jgi:hypothetical protein
MRGVFEVTDEEAIANLEVCAARESGGVRRRAFASLDVLKFRIDTQYDRIQQLVSELTKLHGERAELEVAVAAERERCATACEGSDRYRGEYFAAKIRELK